MKKIVIILVAFVSLGLAATAQQEPHFTMFMFNRQNLNPGYVGSNGASIFEFVGRRQWVDVPGAPTTIAASFNTTLGKGSSLPHSGVGVSFYTDEIGVTRQNYVGLQYAYRALLNKSTVLSMGVQGSLVNRFRDLAALNSYENGDPTLASDVNETANIGNFGAGLYLFSERYYLGVGVPNILRQSYFENSNEELTRHFYGMFGYLFNLNSNWVLRPAVLVKYAIDKDHNSPIDADFNLSAIWNDKLMVGLSYRLEESIDAMVKLRLSDNFFVGYAYDFGIQGIADYSYGSHEITLGFNWGGLSKSVNNPRFVNYF